MRISDWSSDVCSSDLDEDDERRLDLHQALNHRKTVEPRQLDVEEDEVGFVGLDLSYRLAAILCGVDDFDITMRFEPQLQALGRQFFIIHQDGSDRHVRSVPIVICPSGWNGNSMKIGRASCRERVCKYV